MFPELFKIPGIDFTVNTYGALIAVAFLAGLFVMGRQAAQDSLDKNRVYDLGLWVLVASLVGSKLLMIVTDWNEFQGNWRQFLTLDFLRSMGVFYGGFIGAVLASIVVMRIYKLPWWRTADAFAPGIVLGQAIGRLGCYSAGCCWGKPTTAFFGVHFTDKGHETTSVPTIVQHLPAAMQQEWAQRLGGLTAPVHLHPVQLYETAATLVIFVVLLVLARKRKFHGQIILAYALLYAVARFIIEFWRDDPRGELLGLSTSQFVAVLIFIGALGLYLYRYKALNNVSSAQVSPVNS